MSAVEADGTLTDNGPTSSITVAEGVSLLLSGSSGYGIFKLQVQASDMSWKDIPGKEYRWPVNDHVSFYGETVVRGIPQGATGTPNLYYRLCGDDGSLL